MSDKKQELRQKIYNILDYSYGEPLPDTINEIVKLFNIRAESTDEPNSEINRLKKDLNVILDNCQLTVFGKIEDIQKLRDKVSEND
jgi:hypothetical protein